MRYRCLIKSSHHCPELHWCSTDWQTSTEAVNNTVLSQTCCHQQTSVCLCVCLCVLWLCLSDDDDDRAWHWVTLISPSPETLHHCTVRGSANLRDTGKHFTPAPLSTRSLQERASDRLRCSRSVWAEWSNSEQGRREGEASRGVGEGKRNAGETQMRQSWEKQGETDGGGGGTGKALTDSNGGLLTIQEYCLKSICHLGAVEPVITMWYSLFHSDNLFSAFPVHLTPRLYKGHCHLCLPIGLSHFLLINCPHWAIQSFYQGDLHSHRQATTRIDVLLQELLLHHVESSEFLLPTIQ